MQAEGGPQCWDGTRDSGSCPDRAEELGGGEDGTSGPAESPQSPRSAEAPEGREEMPRPSPPTSGLAGFAARSRAGRPRLAGGGGSRAGLRRWGPFGCRGRLIRRPATSAPRPCTLCGSSRGSAVSSVCRERPNDRAPAAPAPRVSAARPRRTRAGEAELRPSRASAPARPQPARGSPASGARGGGPVESQRRPERRSDRPSKPLSPT